jgi:broad specificity phosphatase PhoE
MVMKALKSPTVELPEVTVEPTEGNPFATGGGVSTNAPRHTHDPLAPTDTFKDRFGAWKWNSNNQGLPGYTPYPDTPDITIVPGSHPWGEEWKTQLASGGAAKCSKASVSYEAPSKHAGQRCAICTMFRAPSTCTAVEGKIRGADWCNIFEKKKGYAKGGAVGKTLTVYLVRHGKTALNEDDKNQSVDRIRGWLDVPLTNEGRREARVTAKALRGKGIKAIVSSDLCRASETAKIIGEVLGIKPVFTMKLRPWNLGKLQGKPTKEILSKIEYYIEHCDEKVPGGETFRQFRDRALKGVEEACRQHANPVAIVTHHRVERLMTAWEKAGQTNTRIDPDLFRQKGEKPGHVEVMHLTHFPCTLKPIK